MHAKKAMIAPTDMCISEPTQSPYTGGLRPHVSSSDDEKDKPSSTAEEKKKGVGEASAPSPGKGACEDACMCCVHPIVCAIAYILVFCVLRF